MSDDAMVVALWAATQRLAELESVLADIVAAARESGDTGRVTVTAASIGRARACLAATAAGRAALETGGTAQQ